MLFFKRLQEKKEKTISVRIEAHAYADEELHDEFFLEGPGYAIAGPRAMAPLDRVRNTTIEFKYSPRLTLGEFQSALEKEIWGFSSDDEPTCAGFSILEGEKRYYITNKKASFEKARVKHFDIANVGVVTVSFLVSHDAGMVGEQSGPLRYYMYSHEGRRHNKPHVHVVDVSHKYKASISIETGEILSGELPKKYAKLAKEKVLNDKELFYQYWNDSTDGVAVDINKALGLIKY